MPNKVTFFHQLLKVKKAVYTFIVFKIFGSQTKLFENLGNKIMKNPYLIQGY